MILHRAVGISALCLWLIWIVSAEFGFSDAGILPRSLFGFYNVEFFFGMAAALWLKKHIVLLPRSIFMTGVAVFAAAAIAENMQLFDGYADWSRLVYGAAAVSIVLGIAETSRQHVIVIPKWLRTLGASSYSIYLFQFAFIGVAWKTWLATGLDQQVPHPTSYPLLALAAIAGGIVVSRWIEYPLMEVVRRWRRPVRAVAAT